MPLLTELCSFVDMSYKDAAPTALILERKGRKGRWTEMLSSSQLPEALRQIADLNKPQLG